MTSCICELVSPWHVQGGRGTGSQGRARGEAEELRPPAARSQLAGLALLPRALSPRALTMLAGRQAPGSQR